MLPAKHSHIEEIRLRPGLYLGSRDSLGIEHMAAEVIANSVDQFLAGRATRISVSLMGSSICVSDDGPGFRTSRSRMPRAEHYLTQFHDSPTADGHAPHVHLTYSGYGLVVVNALSSALSLRCYDSGRVTEVFYSRGKKTGGSTRETRRAGRGLSLTFTPDPGIFGDHRARRDVLRATLVKAVHFFPGLRIHFENERFHAPGGIGDFTALLWNGSGPSFSASVTTGEYVIHASARGAADQTQWMSWVNGVVTVGHGTHVAGFKDALRKAGWVPGCAGIHVIMLQPRYAGPTKDKLCNDAVQSAVSEALLPLIVAALEKSEQ